MPIKTTAESQYLAEGDEYAVVDLRQRRTKEARYQKQNSKRAQNNG